MESNKQLHLFEMLQTIDDYRKPRGSRYRLCDLLLLCIYGVLSGHTTAVNIQYYIELNFEYFKNLINLKRVPSHDTLSRVLRFTNFDKLSEILNTWLSHYYPEIYEKYGDYKILHVDGKAVRAASEKSNGEKPIYLMNAMYEGGTINVSSVRVGEKENEISVLPQFLSLFDLNNTIVTIDAMGDNSTVLNAILQNNGDYLTTVKENQKHLYDAIEKEHERLQNSFVYDKISKKKVTEYSTLKSFETIEKNHNRIEKYKVTLLPSTMFIYNNSALKDKQHFRTIGKVAIIDKDTKTREKGKWTESTTRAYIITTLETITAEKLLEIKRSHWKIEMEHWKLDVHYNEDRSTARKDFAIINGTALKRFAMRIKKDSKFNKLTQSRFMIYCNHNPENITKLLFK